MAARQIAMIARSCRRRVSRRRGTYRAESRRGRMSKMRIKSRTMSRSRMRIRIRSGQGGHHLLGLILRNARRILTDF